ncbi:coiled-coil-helix-coiled-coil-helix domain-containing protein 7 [Schistocerca cancellata]|uniref:coiled-coil-helix-coiled-coil-helix domain-containing protein 7 n=1 Tax=Schistocerca cancellata TaxID=274614 RepID=UPI002118F0BD|nr:coiled-coil-helix-coiled-coil-helix domain-containing protein 7 [Schistocerca cancellata]
MTDMEAKQSRAAHRKRDQLNNDDNNPCLKEQEMSLKCLGANNYDKDACSKHFDNYNACKKFWDAVRSDRRVKGIVPYLPPAEEREKVKEEYIATLRR